MSTEEKFRSVENQVELIIRKRLKKLECPYCGKDSQVELLCCEMLAKAINTVLDNRQSERLGNLRIQALEDRIKAAERGEEGYFNCPFCDKQTRIADGEKFCCRKFYDTLQAIAQRLEMDRNTRKFEAILEGIEKSSREAGDKPLVTLH